jgi:predicted nucleic acid-binding protein
LVADNSVVIAWFSRSQATSYTDRLYRRLDKDEVVVPSVWPYEFANALAVLERRRILARALVDDILGNAAKLIARVDTPPASPSALVALARRHGLSAYDAAYLELAQRLGVALAAKDSPLATVAGKLGLLAT